MRLRFWRFVALAGLTTFLAGPQAASAQDVNTVVRTLNNILNPGDAQRLEERARREGRGDEERYWRDYRAGLEHRRAEPEGAYAPSYRGADRRDREIGPDEARRFEEQSRRNHRAEEERYWREYGAGLEPRDRDRSIGRDEARRFEEQSRRNHRAAEERYWRDYRTGLEARGPR